MAPRAAVPPDKVTAPPQGQERAQGRDKLTNSSRERRLRSCRAALPGSLSCGQQQLPSARCFPDIDEVQSLSQGAADLPGFNSC